MTATLTDPVAPTRWTTVELPALRHTQRHLACPDRNDGHDPDGIAGDCYRAALATVLGCGWAKVPHVADYPPGWPDRDDLTDEHGPLWWRRARRWLREHRNADLSYVKVDDPARPPTLHTSARGFGPEPWAGLVVAAGPSPRGPWAHAAVAAYRWVPSRRGGGRLRPEIEVVHDPHPSRAGLDVVESFDVIVAPYDPPPPPAHLDAPDPAPA